MTGRRDMDAPGGESHPNAGTAVTTQRAIRAFAARASHTLRNDIQAVSGGLEAVHAELKPLDLPERAREELARLEQAVARLERRTLDIALVTRAEAGTLDVNRQPDRLKWVLDEAIAQHRAMARDVRVVIQRYLDACETTIAPVDRDRVIHALAAILHNAIRFSPRGGVITVSAQLNGDMAAITIRDQGPGFAPGAAERAFTPYAYGESDEARPKSGLGLGLAVARGIMRAHGGDTRVIVGGTPGGAVVVTLPLA